MESGHAETFRYLILAMQRQGNRILQDMLEAHGITPSQAEVIRVMEEREAVTLKELGNLLICEWGSPSRLVDRMVKDGLIQRQKNPEDSRFVLLKLTEKGRRKAEHIREIEQELYHLLQQKLSEHELETVNGILTKMLEEFPISEKLAKRGLMGSSCHNGHS